MGEADAAELQTTSASKVLQQLQEGCQHEQRLVARWEQLQSVLTQLMEPGSNTGQG
jgi:hypothetical protein